MKKIFIVSRAKNESDIIESFCRYNLTYCDGLIINDNKSSDNTLEILQKLVSEGLPIYLTQEKSQLKKSEIAVKEYGADLIIPLDADEFLYHIDGINPREALEELKDDIEYQIPWRSYVYEKEPDIKFGFMPNNFKYYRNPELEKVQGHAGTTLITNYLIKEKKAKFTAGIHWLIYPEEYQDSIKIENPEKLVCAHFPIRSQIQIKKKAIPNWITKWAVQSNFPYHIREEKHQLGILFNNLKREGDISSELMKKISTEYSLSNSKNNLTIRDIEEIEKRLGDSLYIKEPMNTSFCRSKLNLLYTEYKNENVTFLKTTLKEIDSTVNFLTTQVDDKTKEISDHLQSITKTGTLFFDTGNGFNDNEMFIFNFIGNEVEVNCKIPENTLNVRFDPLENYGCIISNLEILSYGGIVEYEQTNGFKDDNNNLVFTNTDSQILIKNAANWIKIKYRILISSDYYHYKFLKSYIEISDKCKFLGEEKNNLLDERKLLINVRANLINERDGLIKERDRLINERDNLISERDSLLNSRSWRITKTLRNFTDFIRRKKLLYIFMKGVLSIKRVGLKKTIKKIIEKKHYFANISKKLSIDLLIPVLDVSPELLNKALCCILQQDSPFKNLYILTQTGINYKLLSICENYSKKNNNVIIIENFEDDIRNIIKKNITAKWVLILYPNVFIYNNLIKTLKKVIIGKKADFIYTDNIIVDGLKPNHVNMMYKPDYSPDLLSSYNYIGNIFLVKKDILFNCKYDLSFRSIYDIILKITEQTKSIYHISEILYDEVFEDNKNNESKIILNHLLRLGLNAAVNYGKVSRTYKVNYHFKDTPLISIIIPNKDHVIDLKRCIESIKNRSTYTNYEIIIVENNSVEKGTFHYYNLINHSNIKIVKYARKFNFSAINNFGVKAASGKYFIFLNNDTEVITPNWMEELLMYAQRNDVGVVGAKLYYPDGNIQHAGIILGIGGVAANIGRMEKGNDNGYMNRYSVVQNMSAVTAACFLISSKIFNQVGGFDETLPVDFNDVDLCLKIRKKNYNIIFNPYCELYHYESISRGICNNIEFSKWIKVIKNKWKKELKNCDPFYNINFDQDNAAYNIKEIIKSNLYKNNRSILIDDSKLSVNKKLDPYLDISNFERSQEVINYRKKINNIKKYTDGLTIIILNLNKPDLIIPLLKSLTEAAKVLKNKGIEIEIIVGDTGSTNRDVLQCYEKYKNEILIVYNMEYNFSVCNNELFNKLASKKITLFINNDIIFENSINTIEYIYNQIINDSSVGIAGSYLFYPDMSVQHKGVDFIKSGEAQYLCYHVNHGEKIKAPEFGFKENVPAVTGAFLMIKSDLFIEIDGFDEMYKAECQDVALCLSAKRLGYNILVVYTGKVIHLENATRPKGDENWFDRRRFIRKWKLFISEVL